MTGLKFGTGTQAARTWATNVWLPGAVCQRYRQARILAFSTGNVYGLCPVRLAGSVESDPCRPVGEYAMSALGRERIYEHFSAAFGTPMALLRLNYATEMRYGVLADLGRKVHAGQPVDLSMGHLNSLWQGDANAWSLQALAHLASPPFVLNLAGPELLSVRRVAAQFAQLFGKSVEFVGAEADSAFLSNSQRCVELFGYPRVGPGRMIAWLAEWIRRGGEDLGKPTHYESRQGDY
jgi:nucleoside-diphosphate-sugar epimerase